jgi:hypothetical protein
VSPPNMAARNSPSGRSASRHCASAPCAPPGARGLWGGEGGGARVAVCGGGGAGLKRGGQSGMDGQLAQRWGGVVRGGTNHTGVRATQCACMRDRCMCVMGECARDCSDGADGSRAPHCSPRAALLSLPTVCALTLPPGMRFGPPREDNPVKGSGAHGGSMLRFVQQGRGRSQRVNSPRRAVNGSHHAVNGQRSALDSPSNLPKKRAPANTTRGKTSHRKVVCPVQPQAADDDVDAAGREGQRLLVCQNVRRVGPPFGGVGRRQLLAARLRAQRGAAARGEHLAGAPRLGPAHETWSAAAPECSLGLAGT